MSMERLRAEIEAALDNARQLRDSARQELSITETRVQTLIEVLGSMDEIADAEPRPPATSIVSLAERPFGTGRAPRRDVQGCIKQAVRDYMEAKGLGPRLDDVVIGAGILLGSDITESATRRALDGLIAKGEMHQHDNRYAPVGARVSHPALAEAAK
jgi:hypothetical protein